MATTKIDDIGKDIQDILNSFTDDVVQMANSKAEKTAKDAVKRLKATSPYDEGANPKKGHYRDNWKAKKNPASVGSVVWTVYNDKTYRLTHLLENGHAMRNGGRVKAIPHIRPVEELAAEQYEKELTEALKQ